MSNVNGVVTEVSSAVVASGKTMYSVTVNGVSYGFGSYPPKCAKGDIVSFSYTEKGKYKNVDFKSVRVEGKASAEALASATAPKLAPAASHTDNRQTIISKQAALNTAISFVEVLASIEAIPGIGKTTKAEDKYAVVEALVMEKMSEFYKLNTGEDLVEAPAKTEAPKDGAWK